MDDGVGGIHLDLHTDDVDVAADDAVRLGATAIGDHGYRVLASPGGFMFCVVPWNSEAIRPRVVGEPPSLVDQICLDIPRTAYEEECSFWSALTHWDLRQGSRDEFRALVRPHGMPLRMLLQRTNDGADRPVGAHLDIACGQHVDELVAAHVAHGAVVTGSCGTWTTLTDPAGFAYCLTSRDPETGQLQG